MSWRAVAIARVLIATLQGVGVVLVALVAWGASSWATDDSWAARATDALARYSKHSEHVVYPLYELVGTQRQEAA